MRLAVHTDQLYRRDADGISTARDFIGFLGEVARHCEHLVVLGRLDPEPGRAGHPLPDGVAFAELPRYRSSAAAGEVARATAGSLRRLAAVLDDADALWLLGPNALSLPFAALAAARRTPVALGVRQDLPSYVRHRHPGRPGPALAADALDAAFRLLARRLPVVAVGPELAARHAGGRAPVHEARVSLVRRTDLLPAEVALARPWDGPLRLVTATRLDPEKNPLLLADVLALLPERWELVVCGDGPLRGALERRLVELGLGPRATLLGHVGDPVELRLVHRACHAFLHVSWTEGLPQVLFEAFAAGLPVVATDVGGVRAAADGAATLVPPGDADAAARALRALEASPGARARHVRAGLAVAGAHVLEDEAAAVARFLHAALGQATPVRRSSTPTVAISSRRSSRSVAVRK